MYDFLVFFGPASARSHKSGVAGNNWVLGNTFFSETAQRIFLIFCTELGDYKSRKVTAGFSEKILDLEIFVKTAPNYPEMRHFDIFVKNGSNNFFGFWPEVSTKYDLQFEWNLFFRKICYLEIFDLEVIKIWLFSYSLYSIC